LTPAALLEAARAVGVTLRADAGRILASPPRALPPDLAAQIRGQKAQVLEALTGARILQFPTRPAGTPYRLRLGRDYSTDAVKDGEPCSTCQGTAWRLVLAGLWLCGGGHYWSPRRETR
jgi:hypothetical protein